MAIFRNKKTVSTKTTKSASTATKSKKTTAAAEVKKTAPVAKKPINLDAMVEENRTSGTDYQAYLRSRIKKA